MNKTVVDINDPSNETLLPDVTEKLPPSEENLQLPVENASPTEATRTRSVRQVNAPKTLDLYAVAIQRIFSFLNFISFFHFVTMIRFG